MSRFLILTKRGLAEMAIRITHNKSKLRSVFARWLKMVVLEPNIASTPPNHSRPVPSGVLRSPDFQSAYFGRLSVFFQDPSLLILAKITCSMNLGAKILKSSISTAITRIILSASTTVISPGPLQIISWRYLEKSRFIEVQWIPGFR